MKNKCTPEIRFTGFTEDWEQRKLNKLVTPVVREVPKPDRPYKRISVRSHAKGTFHQKVEDPKTVSMDKLYVVRENDLIVNITFAWEHAIAVASKEDDGLLVSHRFPTFIIDKSDTNFIYYSVSQENFRRKMELISPGGAGRNRVLNKKDFVNLKIDVPTQNEEQNKIGNFFKKLDETIALHEQELTTLEQTKQGFLQKMFPKEGESVPEVRFPGYTGDWEQRKLGELADFSKGNGYSKSDLTDKGKPIILYGRLYTKYETVIDSVDTFTIEKEKSVLSKGNEVIIPSSGETSEDISRASVVSRPGIILGGDLNIVHPMIDIDPVFLAVTISNGKQQKELSRRAQGKSVVHLHNSDLKEVNLFFPKKDEQVKIGCFFKQLDGIIALHQSELNALKETKKAFLQKMFV